MSSNRRIFIADNPALQQLGVCPVDGRPLPILHGYAIVYNALSTDRGGYKVRLLPGSARFTEQVHGLYHHEFTGGPLGDKESGTLRIFPDAIGVRFEIDPPNTTLGRDTVELVVTRRVKGMSFAMVDTPEFTAKREGGIEIHEVSDFLCDEITVTGIPAFEIATVAIKDSAQDGIRPVIGYAARTAQSLQFQRLKFDSPSLRLPEAATV